MLCFFYCSQPAYLPFLRQTVLHSIAAISHQISEEQALILFYSISSFDLRYFVQVLALLYSVFLYAAQMLCLPKLF